MLSLILRRLPAGRRHGRAADRRRPRAAATARCARSAASRQATSWSTEPATGSSLGSTRLCASRTYGQRGWNAQPGGRMISEGGRPSIGTSSSSRGVSSRGIERRSPHVYGCCGAAKSSAVGARSTTRPAYMTAMSCVISATTPRSWVIMITAVPGLLLEALDQLEDLRLHGHVERGRRLVGDQQPRLVDQRHGDHRALAHAARELVRVGAEPVAGVRDADQGEHLRRALRGPPAWRRRGAPGRPPRAGRRSCGTDAARRAGPGRSSRSPRRAPGAARRRPSRAGRAPRTAPAPLNDALRARVSPSMVRFETLLPEPDSPTMPSDLPASTE